MLRLLCCIQINRHVEKENVRGQNVFGWKPFLQFIHTVRRCREQLVSVISDLSPGLVLTQVDASTQISPAGPSYIYDIKIIIKNIPTREVAGGRSLGGAFARDVFSLPCICTTALR